ncbi:MAG: hypothetical protein EZS28_041063 [Streblomastix strix]|uniref:Uncharacterized protein n=1 Tax=Streblomastix strix TaxID=222440 RepID=A0A5J4TZK0_9EUKA|nr:MAG: hypothetical protein EZS28_041063 [Streblomastix strix]
MIQLRGYLKFMTKWNVIQFQGFNKGEVVGYNIYTPQLPNLKLYRNVFEQFFTLVPTLCGICDSITALYQVSELLTMVSNKLVGIRCQQSFMGGYAHAVR